jgi:purine-binding chemotaxis protein CheW
MSFDHLSATERTVLQKRAQQLSQTQVVDTNPKLEVVTLSIQNKRYALELSDLRAVLRSKITKLPGLNPVVAGAINVQGELVSVLELALLLGLDLPEATDECVLLVNTPNGNLGLHVPSLPELETIDAPNPQSSSLNEVALLNLNQLLKTAEQTLQLEKKV